MHRRRVLAATAAGATAALAGCRSLFDTRSARSPPLVEDRPNAVYYPTHVEGMQLVATDETGEYGIGLSYSFPHRFWLVTGTNRKQVEIAGDDSVHLMTTVWDRETGQVVPNTSVSTTITNEDGAVDQRSLWPMLSQNMSVHAGDNVALPGDGTYDVEVSVGPVDARTTGDHRGKFEAAESVSFSLEFSREQLEQTMYRQLQDKQGQRGAVEPMSMEKLPIATTPARENMPGRVVGSKRSGDAVFVPTVLDSPPAGVDGDAYLAVSLQTPYNGYPVPFTSVAATLERAGETLYDSTLRPTFDSELGYHYGAAVDAVMDGDRLGLSVGAPPQIARHEGYETAFFEFDDLEFTA